MGVTAAVPILPGGAALYDEPARADGLDSSSGSGALSPAEWSGTHVLDLTIAWCFDSAR